MTNTKTTKPTKQTNSWRQAKRITLAICFVPPVVSTLLVLLTQANLLDGFMGVYRNTPLQELASNLFYGSVIFSPILALVYAVWQGTAQRRRQYQALSSQTSPQAPRSSRAWLRLAAIPLAVIMLYALIMILPTLFSGNFWRNHFTTEGRCRSVDQPSRTIWNKELRQRLNEAETDCINGSISTSDYQEVIDDVEETIRRDPSLNSSRQPQTICTHKAGPNGEVTSCYERH